MVPATFLRGDVPGAAIPFLAFWLLGWTFGGGFALYLFWWSLVGRERVLLTPSRLSIRRELFGFGRVHEYAREHIRDVRVSPTPYSPFDFSAGLRFWGIGGGIIAFDHGAATVRFGAGLDESEAKSIVAQFVARGLNG